MNFNSNIEKSGKVDNYIILQIILVYVLVIIASFFYISMAANFDSSKNTYNIYFFINSSVNNIFCIFSISSIKFF
jgi:hypothetical protein